MKCSTLVFCFFLVLLNVNVSVTVHCVLGYISQDTCYYFDFDAENCFPWNTTLCPEPVVAYRVKKCPSYECFVVSKKSSFFIATIVQYFLQTPEDKVATPDSASSSRSQPTTYPSSPTPRTRTNIDPAIDDGGGKESIYEPHRRKGRESNQI